MHGDGDAEHPDAQIAGEDDEIFEARPTQNILVLFRQTAGQKDQCRQIEEHDAQHSAAPHHGDRRGEDPQFIEDFRQQHQDAQHAEADQIEAVGLLLRIAVNFFVDGRSFHGLSHNISPFPAVRIPETDEI